MCTKEEYYDYLVKLALQPKKAVLTGVMLETLSIIAYKQPVVTKLEIEKNPRCQVRPCSEQADGI